MWRARPAGRVGGNAADPTRHRGLATSAPETGVPRLSSAPASAPRVIAMVSVLLDRRPVVALSRCNAE